MFVYTIQPVVQPVVSCIQTFNRLSNRFENRFHNRLYRVNGVLRSSADRRCKILSAKGGEMRINLTVNVKVMCCDKRYTRVPITVIPLQLSWLQMPLVEYINCLPLQTCLWSPYVIGQTIILSSCSFFLSFFSSPNLSGRRLNVYHTLEHGVALVRI